MSSPANTTRMGSSVNPKQPHPDDVDEIETHYETKLRSVFFDSANSEGTIKNEVEWDIMIAMFLKFRLVLNEDTKKLDRFRPTFPITFETLIQTITQVFGDETIKDLNSNIIENKEQLENCRTYINQLNVRSLKSNELYQLANLLYTCNQKSKQAEKNLKEVVVKISTLSEDSYSFVWDKLSQEHHSTANITLSHQQYSQNKAMIEREFTDRRVRMVHYRKQALKIIKEYDTGMLKVIAYCADHDFPVECFQIPRCFPHFEVLNQFYNQIGAQKQLIRSKYFPSYLGFDDQTNEEYNLYFFEIKKGKALQQMLFQSGQTLKDDQQLFKFWAKELLYAFKDMTYNSTYTIQGDITLKNMYIADLGIKIYLKKIRFGELRDDTLPFHLQTEAKMLSNYANILIEILANDLEFIAGERSPDETLSHLSCDPELKAILYECIHAKDKIVQMEHDTYDGEVSEFILKERLEKQKIEFANEKNEQLPLSDFQEIQNFKKEVQKKEEQNARENVNHRSVQRKGKNPTHNKKNYEEENKAFGIKNDVDLVLEKIAGQKVVNYGDSNYEKAKMKYDNQLLSYSGESKITKSKRQEKYLTVQALLDHPYFISINTADISSVIDQYEIFLSKIVE